MLLVLEHLCQESSRLLVALSEPLLATLMGFLRGGLWCWAVAALLWQQTELRSLKVLLCAWTLGDLMALLLVVWWLNHRPLGPISQPIDWRWIGQGIKTSIPLLLATLALRGLFTFDRYVIEWRHGHELLAAYVFYGGIANAILSVIDASVIAFAFPIILSRAGDKNPQGYLKAVNQLGYHTLMLLVVQCGAVVGITHFLVNYLDNPVYSQYFSVLPWVLLATSVYVVGLVPHIAIYAKHRDRVIVASPFAGLVIFGGVLWLFEKDGDIRVVPLALTAAFTGILLIKTWDFLRLRKRLLVVSTKNGLTA
jgi:hypothetical protein